MPIELSREDRQQAIASLERWFRENRDEPIGNIAAGGLLSFFLEEIGPLVFNATVARVQERMLERVQELDIEFHEDPFLHWSKYDQMKTKPSKR